MDYPLVTYQVWELTGVACGTILAAIRAGRLQAPEKGPDGRYRWRPDDVERVRKLYPKAKPLAAVAGVSVA